MADDNRRYHAYDHGGPPQPKWISRRIDKLKKYRHQRRTEKDHESATDRAARSTALATWAIAVLTVVTIGVGVSQYIIFSRQLDEMRATRESGDKSFSNQIAVMAAQSKTIQGQLDQMALAQRPWITVNATPNAPLIVQDEGIDFSVSYDLQNIGHSPAFNVTVVVNVVVAAYPNDPFRNLRSMQERSCERGKTDIANTLMMAPTLFPGGRTKQIVGHVLGKKDIAGHIRREHGVRRVSLVLLGCVLYKFYHSEDWHQTPFVFDVIDKSSLNNDSASISLDIPEVPADELLLSRTLWYGETD